MAERERQPERRQQILASRLGLAARFFSRGGGGDRAAVRAPRKAAVATNEPAASQGQILQLGCGRGVAAAASIVIVVAVLAGQSSRRRASWLASPHLKPAMQTC